MSPVPVAARRRIDADDIPRLARLLVPRARDLSEYSVANLYLYRRRHDYRLCDGDHPFVVGQTYDGERHAMPLGTLSPDDAARWLNMTDCIYPLGAVEARRLADLGGFRTDDNAADADYVYEAAGLARLARTKGRRVQAARFAALSPRADGFDAAAARAVLQRWIEQAGRGRDHADARECAEAIDRRAALGLDGLSVWLGDAPVAFLLAGQGCGAERIVHFAKGRRDLIGVYPWMFARFAAGAGTALLNFEQDLGNAGLARAKAAFGPTERRRKFRLRRK